MEIKKLNPFSWGKKKVLCLLFAFYAIFIPTFLYIGFQPANASIETNGELIIPGVLSSKITKIKPAKEKIKTPDSLIGSYTKYNGRTLLIAHSTTAFKNLNKISFDNKIILNGEKYLVVEIKTLENEQVDMEEILTPIEEKSIVLMTCAGERQEDGFSQRLIITAIEEN